MCVNKKKNLYMFLNLKKKSRFMGFFKYKKRSGNDLNTALLYEPKICMLIIFFINKLLVW